MTSAKVIFEQQTVTFHSSFLKISSFYQSLSRIAGAKLTNNNPHIADLSDDNRPTKLAEKFGQLYDDAWTDSLEELTEVEMKMEDTVAISFLLRIVMVSFYLWHVKHCNIRFFPFVLYKFLFLLI